MAQYDSRESTSGNIDSAIEPVQAVRSQRVVDETHENARPEVARAVLPGWIVLIFEVNDDLAVHRDWGTLERNDPSRSF